MYGIKEIWDSQVMVSAYRLEGLEFSLGSLGLGFRVLGFRV